MIDFALYLAYGLVALAAIGAFLVPLALAFVNGNLKGLVKMGIGIIIVFVVYFVSYGIAGDEVTPRYELFGIDAAQSQKIGGALLMTYFFMAVAFVGMIFTEVARFFR